jgi:hypothetical protein
MTTPFTVDAPPLQPKNVNSAPLGRDVSIEDYAWAARPLIFRSRILPQTSLWLKGAPNPNVFRTAEDRSLFTLCIVRRRRRDVQFAERDARVLPVPITRVKPGNAGPSVGPVPA